jgi:DNA-binding response OmpR family regulator
MMNEFQAQILLLEDDHNLGLIVEEHLRLNGFEVTLCKDGSEGWNNFNEGTFDLCLVDIMMPKMDGFEFTRMVREQNDTIPIIFLTAKSLQEDKIKGFKIGCDDYITKPFSVEELLLRIQAVLKRANKNLLEPGKSIFEIGEFIFDSKKRILKGTSNDYKLTSKESELLRLLCLNIDETLERNFALKEIWGDESYFNSRSMDVFISKLRKYLKDDENIEIINIHGKGFKLQINK